MRHRPRLECDMWVGFRRRARTESPRDLPMRVLCLDLSACDPDARHARMPAQIDGTPRSFPTEPDSPLLTIMSEAQGKSRHPKVQGPHHFVGEEQRVTNDHHGERAVLKRECAYTSRPRGQELSVVPLGRQRFCSPHVEVCQCRRAVQRARRSPAFDERDPAHSCSRS
jgi:hypothetical protein